MQLLSSFPDIRKIAKSWRKNADVKRVVGVSHVIHKVLEIL